jgi:hypothetical protein
MPVVAVEKAPSKERFAVGLLLQRFATVCNEWAANVFKSFPCHHNAVEIVLASAPRPGRGIRDSVSVFLGRHFTLRGSVLAYRPRD